MIHALEEICLEVTNKCYAHCLHCSSKADATGGYKLEIANIKSVIDEAIDLSRYNSPISTRGMTVEELAVMLPRLQNGTIKTLVADIEAWEEIVRNEVFDIRSSRREQPVLELSGGEPLLRDGIYEIVKYAKDKGFKIVLYTSAITGEGGECISADDVKRWSEILGDNDRVTMSIEGACEKSHEEMTQVAGHFKTSMNAIDLFHAAGISVNVHCTPTRINYKEIPELVKLLRRRRVKEVAFLRLVPQGRALANIKRLRLDKGQFMELQQMIFDEWRRADSSIIVRWGCPIDFRHLLYSVDKKPCHGGRNQIVIRPNGDVHPCAAWKEIGDMNLGNVLETSLRHIWLESEILNVFRKFTPEDLQGECSYCPSRVICGGGCPAQRILANKSRGIENKRALLAVGPDPECFKELLKKREVNGKIPT